MTSCGATSTPRCFGCGSRSKHRGVEVAPQLVIEGAGLRSEEHTSELQSRLHLVCRLLLEKKKNSSGTGGRAPPRNSGCPASATSRCVVRREPRARAPPPVAPNGCALHTSCRCCARTSSP